MKKIAIYPGSFNPFHKGHNNIYEKASKIFDKVYVAKGINNLKSDRLCESKIPSYIQWFQFSDILTQAINQVKDWEKCKNEDIWIIRGIRNSKDFEDNSIQDYWLNEFTSGQIQSIYIECDYKFKLISSSTIRQLQDLNMNIFKQYIYD